MVGVEVPAGVRGDRERSRGEKFQAQEVEDQEMEGSSLCRVERGVAGGRHGHYHST